MAEITREVVSDIHHDLLMECLKVDVLIQATEDHGKNTDFENGINHHLIDMRDRLQILCDRLDKVPSTSLPET